MAFQKKRHDPYLSQADRDRIKAMDDNPYARKRKCKAELTLFNKKLKCTICMKMYGETEKEITDSADEQLKFFKANDKNWTKKSLEFLKGSDQSDSSEVDV